MKGKLFFLALVVLHGLVSAQTSTTIPKYRWGKLSTEYGDIERVHKGKVQPALILADINKDKKPDIILVEKTESPSIVMYVHQQDRKWETFEIEKRSVSAGEAIATGDIDGDGDLDLIAGSDEGKEIWWWENPYPTFNSSKSWKRNYLKRSGSLGHRDIAFGDFDNDQIPEVAFWSNNALWIAKRPDNAAKVDDWPLTMIYSYSTLSQMEQKTQGSELEVKGINYHRGATAADIDLDGTTDLVAGGMWFKYTEGQYQALPIDLGYIGGSSATGQIVEGGWPEIVFSPALGTGPIVVYQFLDGVWKQNVAVKSVRRVFSIQVIDFNQDGFADIVGGEMRTRDITDSKIFVLFNDGKNNFVRMDVDTGKGAHNLAAGDLDGDGDIDLVGCPYSFGAPRLDIWVNSGER